MRERKPTYVYNENGLQAKYPSMDLASKETNVTPSTVRMGILKRKVIAANNLFYSDHTIEEDELKEIFKNKVRRRSNQQCKEKLSPTQEIEVDCRTREVFHHPRKKEGAKNILKKFIYKKLEFIWYSQDKRLTALEKRFVNEMIDSL